MMEFKGTKGPWRWFGSRYQGVYLATPDRGRQYVMSFRRYGMQGAEPEFNVDGFLVGASELVQFEVGDGKARGFKQGKTNRSVYRSDVRGIDHPDARLIKSAPTLLNACMVALETLERDNWESDAETIKILREAITEAIFG